MPTGAVRTAPRNGFPRARGTVDRAQGPDSSAATRADYQPPVVDCAGREAAGTTVSVSVHGSPSSSGHQRFVAARERVELLDDLSVIRGKSNYDCILPGETETPARPRRP
ncbi:hypothetical protein BRC63_08500 [Halobacteriales archaeon QH_10_70_21]|nr:MAG: hypothetical protein BRC63_08500 [Halobacteriales archaeon QH_10_70_21]